MKLITLIITAAIMQVSAASLAQKITMKQQNVPLAQVLKVIRRQTGYNVLWSATKVNLSKPINVDFKNTPLNEALDRIFEGQPFTYEIDEDNVIIKTTTPLLVKPEKMVAAATVQGKVSDEQNQPLVGATVKIKGRNIITTTDAKGVFSITASPTDTLQFSFIGYKTEQRAVGNNTVFKISLVPNAFGLNELVIVGYGAQKKANLTGAVSTVKIDDLLGDRPVTTTGELLAGTVPGLQVTIPTGQPGESKSFNIRGATSISPTGGNAINTEGPLLVVDNVPLNASLNMIDPNDIETITVLKDAGSAAIYGARSAFGVVLITTKKGKKNQKTVFNYSNNLTLSTPTNLPQKATVLQTIQSYKDMGTTSYWLGQDVDTWLGLAQKYYADPSAYPEGYAIVNGIRYPLATTNAYKNLLGNNAKQYMHNFSASGGSDKTTYRVSLGTVDQNGIIVPSSHQDYFNRYNVRSFISSDINEWLNVQVDGSYVNSTTSTPGAGFGAATGYGPYVQMADSLVNSVDGMKYIAGTPKNNVLLSSPTLKRVDDTRITGRAILKPFDGLTLTGEYTFDNLRNLNTSYDKISTSIDPRNFTVGPSGSGNFSKVNALTDYRAINIFGNYVKSLKKHHFSLLAGFNQEESSFEQESLARTVPISNDYPSITQATGPITGGDSYSEYANRGFFGRFNYDYDGKYLLEVNGRDDISSKFPENHRSGFFPSVSAGWAISKEKFMEKAGWLSELKLRGSFGSVGNQNINPYQFVPGLTANYADWLNNYSQVTTLNPPPAVSANFTWATIQTADIGLDFGFLNNRLAGSFDIYQRDTKNMLYNGIQLPAIFGTTAPLQNVAALRTKGYELEINWRDKIGNVGYHIGTNLYDFISKITKIQNTAGLLSQYYVGQQLGEIWGYETDRLYTVNDFVPGTLNSGLTGGTLKPGIPKVQGELPNPGDVLYKDLNGDGLITPGSSTLSDPGDRKIIGNNALRYQFGINGGVNYSNIDFSFVISGVGKQDQFRDNVLSFPNDYAFGTIYAYQLNYWTPTNTNSFYGRTYDQAKGNQKFNQYPQTRYLLNGANLRVRNLTLGYTFPTQLINKWHIQKFHIFGSVENAFTFDHLPKGSDPSINPTGNYGYDYPFMRMYSIGVNATF